MGKGKTLTKEEFEDRANIRLRYENFREEYGDACGFYDGFLNEHYLDYIHGLGYLDLPREDPHHEGYVAFTEGKTEEANPYPSGDSNDTRADEWLDGWTEAQLENERIEND